MRKYVLKGLELTVLYTSFQLEASDHIESSYYLKVYFESYRQISTLY